MIKPGVTPSERNTRVDVLRSGGTSRGALGGVIEGPWVIHARAWAQVRYGTGAERREAASKVAGQSAIFVIVRTASLAGISVKDRLRTSDGALWDVTSVVPSLDLASIQIAATMRVG